MWQSWGLIVMIATDNKVFWIELNLNWITIIISMRHAPLPFDLDLVSE